MQLPLHGSSRQLQVKCKLPLPSIPLLRYPIPAPETNIACDRVLGAQLGYEKAC